MGIAHLLDRYPEETVGRSQKHAVAAARAIISRPSVLLQMNPRILRLKAGDRAVALFSS